MRIFAHSIPDLADTFLHAGYVSATPGGLDGPAGTGFAPADVSAMDLALAAPVLLLPVAAALGIAGAWLWWRSLGSPYRSSVAPALLATLPPGLWFTATAASLLLATGGSP